MHPKEFKKTKNNTGRFTHLLLQNSKIFIGDDFTNHNEINEIIKNTNAFILYPSKDAINLSQDSLHVDKNITIFLIDSTWSCSTSLLRKSKNLQVLPSISFDSTKLSEYKIKEQPKDYCLSTIESTLCVLELLNEQNIENISSENLNNFLNPFHEMVKYQIECIENREKNELRYKSYS
jgi:DTW domain-containing protein YfiP